MTDTNHGATVASNPEYSSAQAAELANSITGTLNATEAADTAAFTATITPQQPQPQQPPEPQALADYARRVGAERRNFRRYVIKEQQRELYHFDRYIIKISRDGEVTVREAHGGTVPDEIKPTDEEQTAIKAACASGAFPTAKSANQYDVEKLLKLVGRDAVLFKFRDPHNENFVTFVQQRKFRKDETKLDLPWSFWSNDEWYCMEPDYEQLPLFGLEQLKQLRLMTVYVHEGAKTAWFMQQVETMKLKWWRDHAYTQCELWSDRCPWTKELKGDGFQVAHIGWPGGAPNAYRVDWEPLRRLPPYVKVIVVLPIKRRKRAGLQRPHVSALPPSCDLGDHSRWTTAQGICGGMVLFCETCLLHAAV